MTNGLCILAPMAALAACTPQAVTSPAFGSAQAQNELMQVVTMAPHPSPEAAPDYNGQRAEAALKRYGDGKVFRPAQINTSSIQAPSEGPTEPGVNR